MNNPVIMLWYATKVAKTIKKTTKIILKYCCCCWYSGIVDKSLDLSINPLYTSRVKFTKFKVFTLDFQDGRFPPTQE